MRLLTLALLGLMMCAAPTLAANHSGPAGGGEAAAKARPLQAARPALKAPSQAVRHRAGSHAAATCGRTAAGRCRAAVAAPARFGWSQGLPPAAGIQADACPDGTMATLAHGHEDVVRCMPI
ncbi:hypothetical protein [Paracraurococcus lichenis]|uniref:Uncharacterized protein n=1 Tax=Paracraurococcus lichenis TaxID=3064888 RepID=A0ABT9E6P2_9PROT|nr:hypothetical protein [Paracraurococcus sp. LOR1-02]MDO9711819.1 hypothetical protein [Paracraurococcus sp. LOR1-02]